MPEQFLHGVDVVIVDDGGRPIEVPAASIIGVIGTAPLADPVAFPLNTPVRVTSLSEAAKLKSVPPAGTPDEGTLPDALDSIYDQARAVVVVIRVAKGVDDAATMANILGGANAQTGAYEGVHAFLGAQSALGIKPRILIAPGYSHQRPVDPQNAGQQLRNPVVAELEGIADRMRAVIVADGPSTTDTAAIAAAGDSGSKRVYLIDPRVKKLNAAGAIINSYSSAAVAGVIARSDKDRGWHASPSNQAITGIIGVERPIDFEMGDYTSRANLLNAANVATIIREDGYRLWGNRTLSDDPRWQFLSIVRTADMIADILQRAHLWAVDRGITKTYVEDVRENVGDQLRALKFQGAITGGECWIDPELNTPANIASGKFFWDFDFGGVYPGEHLTFRMHFNNNYLTEIV